MIDLHELSTERSLAFHREIARRLLGDAGIVERALRRVRAWQMEGPQRPHVRQWAEILEGTPESIAAFLVDLSESAQELRQSSPFAGVLSPAERWRIWNETRDAYVSRQ
jgi:hypothetical protein